jgi:hypothetical protein
MTVYSNRTLKSFLSLARQSRFNPKNFDAKIFASEKEIRTNKNWILFEIDTLKLF